MLLVLMLGATVTACDDDDDDDVIIAEGQLPKDARDFLSDFYPGVKVTWVERDTDKGELQYDVKMANGHEITFDAGGRWVDVDAPKGQSIPDGIALPPIVRYVETHYTGAGINEISRLNGGNYEVELTIGTELLFDPAGEFLSVSY